jgi:hypothetical protein
MSDQMRAFVERLHRWQGLVAPLVLAALLLPGLGGPGLLDPWEMDRAAVARRMAGGPRVLVVESSHGELLPQLERAAPRRYGLARPSEAGDTSAATALVQANSWLGKQVAHAIVIDADAALAGRSGLTPAVLADRVVGLSAQEPGAAVLVATTHPEVLHEALARARARELQAVWKAATQTSVLDGAEVEGALARMLAGGDLLTTPDQLATQLAEHVPSPMRLAVHKKDNASVAMPWLDAALTAMSLRALGPTEAAARLPGALCVLLAGWLVVWGVRRLWGPREAWLALGVYLTLPLTWGLAHAVTLEASAPLGLLLVVVGLALGDREPRGLVLLAPGLAVLLAGQGMAGLAMAVGTALASALVAGGRRLWGATLASALVLGLAALWIYRWAPADPLLRGLRFSWASFGPGPDQFHRDFAWFIGQLGFAVYPWGAVLVLGLARLLGAPADRQQPAADRVRPGAVVLAGLVVGLAVEAILVRQFQHFVAPVGAVVAVIVAVALGDLWLGHVGGRVTALFVLLATFLLHHDIGKEAAAVTRFFAFDPPPQLGTGEVTWPTELSLPRALRAVALLAVLVFALGAARVHEPLAQAVLRLRRARAAAWALGVVGTLWLLDALISLGTKLDVLLKALANTTNYHHDRVYVTLMAIRPEVIAGATAFVLLLVLAIAATRLDRSDFARLPWLRLPLQLASLVDGVWVTLTLATVAAVTVLLAGCSVFVHVRAASWGQALAVGFSSAAFWVPAGLLLTLFGTRLLARRWPVLDPYRDDSLLAPLTAPLVEQAPVVLGLTGLAAVAGIGVGASQAVVTWSWPYLAAVWLFALVVTLAVLARAQFRAAGYGWVLAGFALVVVGSLFGPLAARYVAEHRDAAAVGQEAVEVREAWKYLARVLLLAPDALACWLLAGLLLVNRWAGQRQGVARWFDRAVALVRQLERPAVGVGALLAAGVVFAVAFAGALLPGMAVHFSQKHLLVRVAEAAGTTPDPSGAPRVFTYGSSRSGGDNNFYTQSLPRIDDKAAILGLLGDRNVATRITDNAEGGATRLLAVPGWRDALDGNRDGRRDAPAFFGIASRVDGARVQVADARWQPGQWQGATLYGSGATGVGVLDNTADTMTLAAPATLTAEDPNRGAFTLDKGGDPAGREHAGSQPVGRFVLLAKDAFSELNHAFRQANDGAFVPVLDAASSRLVLATNRLPAGRTDQNWLRQAVIRQKDFDALTGLQRVYVNFDNSIELIAYKLAEPAVARSQKYKLTLYWRVKKPTATSWKLFMHPHPLHLDRWPLTPPDPSEDDNKPCNGCFQTNHWLAGDIIVDAFEQEVPLGTQSGPNEIILGWYNPSGDNRLPVITATGHGVVKHGDNRATIGQLLVR